MIRKLQKIPGILEHQFYYTLQKMKLANLIINNHISPLNEDQLLRNLEKDTINISLEDYDHAIDSSVLRAYKTRKWHPNTKILEYLSSYIILNIENNETLLDAAGGAEAEFARFMRIFSGKNINIFCQDANSNSNKNFDYSDINFIAGSIDRIPLPDKSLDVITCHHSFEHFEKDLDTRFIKECLRLLSDKGRLLITPIFLTNKYSEITNKFFHKKYDDKCDFFYDPSSTFPGWGGHQGFARTYNNEYFKKRILDFIPDDFEIKIISIHLDGIPTPKFDYAYYQPKLNMNMKSLLVKRKQLYKSN